MFKLKIVGLFLWALPSLLNAATPVISNITSDVVANIGDDVRFNCTVTNVGKLSVNWVKRASSGSVVLSMRNLLGLSDVRYAVVETTDPQADAATYSFSIANIEPSDTGLYECQVTLSTTEKITKSLNLLLNAPAAISVEKTNATVTASEGHTLVATCHAGGYPKPTISWIREGNALLPLGGYEYVGSTFEIADVNRRDRGNYFCVADNGIGQPDKRLVRFDVEFAPVIRVFRPKVGQALGLRTQLECHVEGYPAPVISWRRKGEVLQSSSSHEISNSASPRDTISSVLRISTLREADLGDYYCNAANKFGVATSRLHLFATGFPTTY